MDNQTNSYGVSSDWNLEFFSNGPQIDVTRNLTEDALEKILVWIDIRELCHSCRLVCKAWRNVIDSTSFLRYKCRSEGINAPLTRGVGMVDLDLKSVLLLKPYDRNLIRNWNAQDNFKYWHVREYGGRSGSGWLIEPNNCFGADLISTIGINDLANCWTTSHRWCTKGQRIDLVKEGVQSEVLDEIKPVIVVSDFITARADCQSEYKIQVRLLDMRENELDSWRLRHTFDQKRGKWLQVIHKFENYPEGVRFVDFEHGGKDTRDWRGHYGSKFTGSALRIVLDGHPLPLDIDTGGNVEKVPY